MLQCFCATYNHAVVSVIAYDNKFLVLVCVRGEKISGPAPTYSFSEGCIPIAMSLLVLGWMRYYCDVCIPIALSASSRIILCYGVSNCFLEDHIRSVHCALCSVRCALCIAISALFTLNKIYYRKQCGTFLHIYQYMNN